MMRIKLAHKIVSLAMLSAVLPVFFAAALIFWHLDQTQVEVDEDVDELIEDNIAEVASGVYNLCETTNSLIQTQVDQGLLVARSELQRQGEVEFSKEKVNWDALNQYTKETLKVALPKLTIGGTWLSQNRDPSVPTLITDDVQNAVGGTITIFQRMNSRGDMLRVATNVMTKENERAVGTYIPASYKGIPDPVVSTVLEGRTFRGRAFVVDDWYITAYEPLRNEGGEIIGMLYFGVKQRNLHTLRDMIRSIQIGTDGYVFVVGGKGNAKGKYIISKDFKRDGEDIWNAKDAGGGYFIQAMIRRSISSGDKKPIFEKYPWQNAGEERPRMKTAAVVYYEPWDWVIGASIYQDDMRSASDKIIGAVHDLLRWCLLAALGIAVCSGALAAIVAARFTKPVSAITSIADAIADGNFDAATKAVAESWETMGGTSHKRRILADETVGLLQATEKMTTNLSSLVRRAQHAGIQVTSSSTQIAAGAKQLEANIADQAASTSEVLATTTEISGVARELAQVVSGVTESAMDSAAVAGSGRDSLKLLAKAMERLAESTNAIAERLNVINDKSDNVNVMVNTIAKVADQTNLLSLNASIEAEKAGEAGKGFSVVAREIRRLADQTAVATLDIDSLVNDMREAISTGVDEMGRFADEVVDIIKEVGSITSQQESIIKQVQDLTPAFTEVREGMDSQAQGAEQIRDAIVQLSEGTELSAQALSEFKRTASTLQNAAREMQDEISRFKVSSDSKPSA